MAYTLPAAFDEFYGTVNLPGDHRATATKRREWLEKALKGKLDVLEAFAFGSIPRFTALQDHADVDVLVALHYGNHVKDKKPSEVLQLIRDALKDYATSLRRNGQAVTLTFKSWPHVDIVPASRCVDPDSGEFTYFDIPDMNREVWLRSDPKAHTRQISSRASDCGQNFRRLITMAKHWNRLKNSGRLQSYHIEAIAVDTFSDSIDSMPWAIKQFFEAVIGKLDFHWYDSSNAAAYLDYTTTAQVRSAVTEASKTANEAWLSGALTTGSHEEAIKLWRKVFGMKFPAYG